MANMNEEKKFIDSLIENGDVQDLTLDKLERDNEKRKNMFEGIKPSKALIVDDDQEGHIKEGNIFEAPGDEMGSDVGINPEAPIDEPMDEPVEEPMDEPVDDDEPIEEPMDDEENPVTAAVMALFLTSIIRTGSNFKEYKSEAMKEALAKQGVDEDTYNAIGKALYELDTKSDMFN